MINKIIKKILFIVPILFVIISNISLAQSDGTENIKKLGDNITNNVVSTATTLIMTAAFMIFFYGVVVFIYGRVTGSGDMKDIAKGREFMMWGLIALFVMVSVSGIIKLFQTSLDINGSSIDIKPVSFSYSGSSGSNSNSNSSNNNKSTNGVSGGNSGSLSVENPFANTANFPVIRVGANNTLKGGAGGDQPIIDLLFKLLQKKNCISNNISGFGTTYDIDDTRFTKAFQTINKISPVDGIVGKVTWEALSTDTGKTTINSKILVKDCTAPVQ